MVKHLSKQDNKIIKSIRSSWSTSRLSSRTIRFRTIPNRTCWLAPQLGRGDIATLGQVGGIQQQQSQNVLDAQAQANQMQAMEPYPKIRKLMDKVSEL